MTKSKMNHFMKTIQSGQQSLNIISLNCSFKAYFDQFIVYHNSNKDELRNRTIYLRNYFRNTNPYGVLRLPSNFIIHLPSLPFKRFKSKHLNKYILPFTISSSLTFTCINSTTFIEKLQTVYYNGDKKN